jgi:hypothetical protein
VGGWSEWVNSGGGRSGWGKGLGVSAGGPRPDESGVFLIHFLTWYGGMLLLIGICYCLNHPVVALGFSKSRLGFGTGAYCG